MVPRNSIPPTLHKMTAVGIYYVCICIYIIYIRYVYIYPAGRVPSDSYTIFFFYLPPQPSPPHDPSQRPSREPAGSSPDAPPEPSFFFFFFFFCCCCCGEDFSPSWSPIPTPSTAYKVLKISRKASTLIQNIPGNVLSSRSDASAGFADQRGEDGPQSPRYWPGSSPRV